MAKEEFKVYNSMTQQKEIFKPKNPGKVGMYVCGVTAYDFSHLGHARAAVNFDILYRYLVHLGYEVTYVRNFTDVDDKIIKRSNELDEDPLKLSDRFCTEYIVDMTDLQCLIPTEQPRVSDHMEQIKDMISQIIKKDYAYEVDGDVFYAVEKFPNYGMLSGQKLEHNRAGERVAVDSRKRHPADFALWKAAKPGEPSWDSPWGPGRPGWHIECSAMSSHYLGFEFDVHGGGIDLIFPHHENEIAQSCAACEECNISYWMHNGHVTNNNEKMSKSLGNFFTIRQITERYHPLALRHFLTSAHYRSPLNYTVWQLESSSDAVYYIYQIVLYGVLLERRLPAVVTKCLIAVICNIVLLLPTTLKDCEDALSSFQEGNIEPNKQLPKATPPAMECIEKMRSEFREKMSDDLNTAQILTGGFQDALKILNVTLASLKKKLQKQQQLSLIQSIIEIEKEVKEILGILGLLSSSAYAEVLQQFKDKALKRAGLVEADVLNLIEERTQARNNKDFSKSDKIRADLTEKGIALMDVGKETVWRPCIPTTPLAAQEVPQDQKAAIVEE